MNRSVESLILTAFNTKVNFETDFLFPAVQKYFSDRLKKMLNPLFSANPALFHPGRGMNPKACQPGRRIE